MKKILYYLLAFSIITISCNNSAEYKKIKKDFADVEFIYDTLKLDSFLQKIPDYGIIVKTIKTENLKYNQQILLNPNTADEYLNSKETAFAAGLFTADLGYVRYFQRVQECMDFMYSLRILAEKLAISDKNFDELVPAIERNLYNKDSIFIITDSAFNLGKKLFNDRERYGIAALFASGIWIETLYLGLNSTADKNINDTVLINHFEILKIINNTLSALKDDDIIKKIKKDFNLIENKGYNNPELKKDISSIRLKYLKSL
ncbi:MAG: hypothetical protein WHW07_05530 [Bacteroidales bacterium]|jgi:hypothetical protein|nr:hypothetical protein [Bacteroidales bacterium]HOL98338.1 hypothetical protein [Bacteroidales bacterium]HOM35724.1 hypothetical protein [Bacteroidales bacterium]HPD23136.1 hypothetical protein [Bacteroidales bacterium]HRS99065.1 hypothetical protein [Bacteroidales bacterium]